MISAEALNQYNEALKLGKKYYKNCVHEGKYPYLQTLDWLLEAKSVLNIEYIGTVDIPTELIRGTKTEGRKSVFAGNFMPIVSAETEFAHKWIALCSAHLSEEGIREPIKCYEYMGRFYVEEGNKRVSVLSSFNAPSIPGVVERILPDYSDDIDVRVYYEFLQFYKLSRSYRFRFNRLGQFSKLQAALGFDVEHVWSEDERKAVNSALAFFKRTLSVRHPEASQVTVSNAFLVWLQLYSLDDIRSISGDELTEKIVGIWTQVQSMENDVPITVSTEEPVIPNLSIFERLIMPNHIKVAFIHEFSPEKSSWIRAHEEGRVFLEEKLGASVETSAYFPESIDCAEEVMEKAISEGAKVIISTTPPLINSCRRIAAKYKDIDILNCSISMPYPGVRTYYSRIYEGKFVSGAIAGAMSKSNVVGYIASNPIFGVPAGINAFAMGAMMTNPDIRVKLVWSCTDEHPFSTLLDQGISVISNRDIPTRNQPMEHWGLCRQNENGQLHALASPYWNWGNFYVKVVSGILNGSWGVLSSEDSLSAVNYWWGMLSGTVGVRLSDELPNSVKRLAEILKRGLKDGSIEPFHTRLVAQDGSVKSDGDRLLTTEEIISMDWLCDCIDGQIPQFYELLPMSQEIVRLQGIYRGWLPPEKGGVLL